MTEIVKQESVLAEYNTEQIEILKTQIAKGCNNEELKYYLTICKHLDLNPFNRQIYALKRRTWNSDKQAYDEHLTVQMGIDGFRLIAERTGKYAGSDEPVYTFDTNWKLEKATVTVKKLIWGQIVETTAPAYYEEYVQTYKDKKTQQMIPNSQWIKMPRLMLGKCAEALALRKAFPQELSGVYSEDEVGTMESHAEEFKPEMANDEDKAELVQLIGWSGVPPEKFYEADKVSTIDEYTPAKIRTRIDIIKKRLEEKANEEPTILIVPEGEEVKIIAPQTETPNPPQ